MATQTQTLSTTDILSILDFVFCFCGNQKQMGQPFCHRCYYTLPPAARQFIRYIKNDSFRGTYDAAVEYLEREGINPC